MRSQAELGNERTVILFFRYHVAPLDSAMIREDHEAQPGDAATGGENLPLVPKLRLGAKLLKLCFSVLGCGDWTRMISASEAELPQGAFPSGAWERANGYTLFPLPRCAA